MTGFTEERFVALVRKSEAEAARSINAYKFRLALFALFGYGVIFGVLALLVVLAGGTIAILMLSSTLLLLLIKTKIIYAIPVSIWILLRSLWVSFDAPTGYVLERGRFPVLFRETDQLTRSLDSLRIHQVILDTSLNAGVVQHPRFGVLGGQRNTLMLGLQLLLMLSPEEMKSVLAHEFGHLSGNHSHFAGWIYRIRLTWARLMDAFAESESWGAKMMRRFFDWYSPTFSAYSFALARNNEYEADQMAAELTSPQIAARALVNAYTRAPSLQTEFWDAFVRKADDMPEPATLPFTSLSAYLKQQHLSRERLDELVKQGMQNETHYADTHPALKDRLKGLGAEVVLPDAVEKSAAEEWFGPHYTEILQHFDKIWLADNQQSWQKRHAFVQSSKELLERNAATPMTSLDDKTLWDLALATLELLGNEAALPLFQGYLQRSTDSVGAHYHVGRILAARDDETALTHLMVALGSPDTFHEAAHLGYGLLSRKDKQAEAEQWWGAVLQKEKQHRRDARERASVSDYDTFEAPIIEPELLAALLENLAGNKRVGSVWLAQKVLSNKQARPVYVIAFQPKGFSVSLDGKAEALAKTLVVNMDIYVVCLRGDNKALAKSVRDAGRKIK